MNPNRRILRWRLIVDRKLQGSLCAHGVLNGILVLTSVSIGIFLPLLWSLGDTDGASGFEDQAVVMLYMHERFWWLALLCLVIVVIGAIKFSHRIAGPLVRFKRNLRLMADGKLPSPLRTRSGDFLQDEVACLNAAVAGLWARVESMQKAGAALQRELEAAAPSGSRRHDEFATVLAAQRELARCLQAIQRYDTQDEVLPQTADVGRSSFALAASGGEGG